MQATITKIFGRAALYIRVIDEILPIVGRHEYHFMSDEYFHAWLQSEHANAGELNRITAFELVEKSHLSAVTALVRTKSWVEAICATYDIHNYVGWASSCRGLVESAGDIVDGLLPMPLPLATHHRNINRCLSGAMTDKIAIFEELEQTLDHFVHAKWMRTKRGDNNPLKAKENADYVSVLTKAIPDALNFYHRLCSIAHPSNASIEHLYDTESLTTGSLRISPVKGDKAISEMMRLYPDALPDCLMLSCNPAFLVLRVLHKFKVHPLLAPFKNLRWDKINGWPKIEQELK